MDDNIYIHIYILSRWLIYPFCLVSHGLEFADCIPCQEVKHPYKKRWPRYNTKPSGGEATILDLGSNSSLPLLPGPLWVRMVVPVWLNRAALKLLVLDKNAWYHIIVNYFYYIMILLEAKIVYKGSYFQQCPTCLIHQMVLEMEAGGSIPAPLKSINPSCFHWFLVVTVLLDDTDVSV